MLSLFWRIFRNLIVILTNISQSYRHSDEYFAIQSLFWRIFRNLIVILTNIYPPCGERSSAIFSPWIFVTVIVIWKNVSHFYRFSDAWSWILILLSVFWWIVHINNYIVILTIHNSCRFRLLVANIIAFLSYSGDCSSQGQWPCALCYPYKS